jgi:hypothetical protein
MREVINGIQPLVRLVPGRAWLCIHAQFRAQRLSIPKR